MTERWIYDRSAGMADLQEARAAQRAFELSTEDAMQRFADLFVRRISPFFRSNLPLDSLPSIHSR